MLVKCFQRQLIKKTLPQSPSSVLILKNKNKNGSKLVKDKKKNFLSDQFDQSDQSDHIKLANPIDPYTIRSIRSIRWLIRGYPII